MPRLFGLLTILFLSFIISCSDDKDEEVAETTLDAVVSEFSNGTATLNFNESQADQEYIILPFHLGSIDTTNGAGVPESPFTVTSPATGALRIKNSGPGFTLSKAQKRNAIEHISRTIINSFDPGKSAQNQREGFWDMVRTVDRYHQNSNEMLLEDRLLERIARYKKVKIQRKLSLTATGACLGAVGDDSADYLITDDIDPPSNTIKEIVSHDDYCLLFLESSGYALTHKDEIKSTVEKSLAFLKSTIYQVDSFPDKKIKFKPNFFFGSPEAILGLTGVTGAYFHAMSKEQDKPVLIMTHDLVAIGKDESEESVGELHATIIHELQHAIHNYYRSDLGTQDNTYIDEGLAHLIEDLAGYSDNNNFSNYAFSFLLTRMTGEAPFMPTSAFTGSDSDLDTKGRGAGHAFFYYLASQKGGFEVTNGTITGGKGLEFISSISKSGKNGIKNVRDLYLTEGVTWQDVIGDYLVSLHLDQDKTVQNIASIHQVYPARQDITDLQGKTNKGFGMHFNHFKDLESGTNTSDLSPLKSETFNLRHYQTKPLYFKVSAGTTSLQIKSDTDAGYIVSIRIK